MKPFVTQVWPQFTADAQFNACFGQVLVERVELYRTARKVIICLRSAEPLDGGLCGRLAASLEPVFEGYELTLKNYFNYGSITPEAARQIIEELKSEGLPVNGFLDKSPISIQDGEISIHVAAGMNILQSIDFPRRLAERIQERTGTLPVVRMVATGKTVAPEEFEKYVQQKTPAVKFEAKKDLPPIQVQGLDLADKPVKVFHGKYFKPADLKPLNDLGDGGKVTVWGDVFATEVKGNRRKIYFTSITDYTGSVSVKMLADDGADMSKWEGIKPGTTFIIRGDYNYDKYEHDFVLYPTTSCRWSARPGRTLPPKGTAGWSCTCTPSPAPWTASVIPARSSAWPTAWDTGPSPSPTTASARATRRPCWPPMTSTRRTPTSS